MLFYNNVVILIEKTKKVLFLQTDKFMTINLIDLFYKQEIETINVTNNFMLYHYLNLSQKFSDHNLNLPKIDSDDDLILSFNFLSITVFF